MNDGQLMLEQISSFPVRDIIDDGQHTKEVTTSLPLLDQHILLLKEYSPWLVPTAGGILAVGLRFFDPFMEYIDLNSGLIRNILESISGKIGFHKHYEKNDANLT